MRTSQHFNMSLLRRRGIYLPCHRSSLLGFSFEKPIFEMVKTRDIESDLINDQCHSFDTIPWKNSDSEISIAPED